MMDIPFAHPSFPERYEQALVGPLFRPFAELLLQEVGLGPGDRVLDVACGTGIVARLAKERVGEAGRVVGVDLNPQMLAVAHAAGPGIDWREGDAAALPLREGEQFDVVLCQQGLQFVPDRAAAAREMRCALAPNGRLAVTTWRSDEEVPLLRELRRVAEGHLGPITDPRYSVGDAGVLEALLRRAGFHDVRTRTVSASIRFPDASQFVRINALALVGMSPVSSELTGEERQQIVDAITRESAELLQSHIDAAGLAFEASTNSATAGCPLGD